MPSLLPARQSSAAMTLHLQHRTAGGAEHRQAPGLRACRWLVLEELKPPTTIIMSGFSPPSTMSYTALWRSCVASQMVSITMYRFSRSATPYRCTAQTGLSTQPC